MHDGMELFFWTCALGAAIAIPFSLRKSRLACGGWFAFYLLGYSILSAQGHYAADAEGTRRWMPSRCVQEVRAKGRQQTTLSPLGGFFLPFVQVDRIIFHPSKEPGE
ncbi:MAG TPA: hypothetical protein VK633_04920 [Verrucomicrobiae bacterium]|nr:hypothetical protein [Verrucomicrobiae bacterium]